MLIATVRFTNSLAQIQFEARMMARQFDGWKMADHFETDRFEFYSDMADQAADICNEIAGTFCVVSEE
jgi:hypothetical protein